MTTPPPEPPLARLGRLMVRRRRVVVLAWIAVLALALVAGPKLAGEFTVDYSTPNSDSQAVADTIDTQFPALSAETVLFTWTSPAGAESAPAKARVNEVLAQLAAIPGIEQADPARAQISPDGKTGLIEIPQTKHSASIALDDGPELVATANAASTADAQIRLGGFAIQESERGAISSEGVGLTVALLILLATFGTIVAAGLPIATALFGIGTGAALVGVVAGLVDTPEWAESVATMVGIGVGIDYALLVLTRHRAAMRTGASIEDSVAIALTTAGRSVLVAGTTVVISMLGLLLMGLPYLTGVAFSASASVLAVMIASVTLLPALLGFAGTKIDALAVGLPGGAARRARRAAKAEAERGDLPADASPAFARWSHRVQRRPWTATAVGLVIIGLLTAPLAGVRLGFPGMGDQPVGSQTREAFDQLTAGFGPGVAAPLRVIVPTAEDPGGSKVTALSAAIAAHPRVAAVQPPMSSTDGRSVLVTVQSRAAADDPASDALLQALRDDLVPASGLSAMVGGLTAETHDQAYATRDRLPVMFLGVAGLSALLLLAAFRSALIPLKAAVMNLLSIAAAYGVVSLVAEGGAVGQLIGIDGEVPIPPFIPVLMFAVLFGLSMDYEVFLLGRIRELWLESGDAARAVTHGLAATARVITAAAAIMVAVFGAFALSDEVFLKLIGIGMASAILIDATVIRLLLVPAIMGLMGDRAWWLPRWLDRIVPQTDLEGPSHPAPRSTATPADRGAAPRTGRAAPDLAS